MNAEGTKRLALIKSLVREQGADGDKCWLIVQLETEAQALEAGVPEIMTVGGDTPFPLPEVIRILCDAADCLLLEHNYDGHGHEVIAEARDAGRKLLAGEPGEVGKQVAKRLQAAFVAGADWATGFEYEEYAEAAVEADRRYPEKPQEVKQ